ncbi:MAG: glycerophosphodiester phosphodiesterase [Thermodesulfovibrionales bacterium]|nr:glycerophosphodiester phosphodiesterase [Thermodesulfovibrionales bacterium]
MSTFLKVGHRGAKAYETENTLESFTKAIELGANAIELDVRTSGDGELILIHDDNLKRVFGSDVPVKGVTLNELKELTGNRIATLDEALRYIGRKVEKILVELKEVGYEDKVIETVRKMNLTDRVILLSFHEESLARARDLDRTIETGLVYTKLKKPLDAALRLNAQYIVPLYRFVHAAKVTKAHKKGLKVIVWTINTENEARTYRAKDVDGIATDKPDILKGII